MVNQEVLGGLRAALSKGETLFQGMMALYNAGYSKTEIEEAARVVQMEIQGTQQQSQMQQGILQIPQKQFIRPLQQKTQQPLKSVQSQTISQKTQKPVQKVSTYGPPPKSSKKNLIIVIFLIVALLFLIGVLVGTFLFKQEILNLFGNIFG